MITATSKKDNYITELSDGKHTFYADTVEHEGGSDMYARPTDILCSAYAACTNITTRMVLDREGLKYDKVTVWADIDRSDLNNVKFYIHTEIEGDIPQEKKNEIIQRVKRCPVCRILKADKEFLELNIDEI
jgi:putative redox protein